MTLIQYLKLPLKIVAYSFYYVVRIIPRKQNKWVFGSLYGYADNAKYLFRDVIENHPEIRAIWISRTKADVLKVRERGYEAYHRYLSFMGIYHCLTAKVYICTVNAEDISTYFSGGAFLVNLWHGVGLKRIKWLNPEMFLKRFSYSNVETMSKSFIFRVETFPILYRNPEALLVPSDFQAESIFIPAFKRKITINR